MAAAAPLRSPSPHGRSPHGCPSQVPVPSWLLPSRSPHGCSSPGPLMASSPGPTDPSWAPPVPLPLHPVPPPWPCPRCEGTGGKRSQGWGDISGKLYFELRISFKNSFQCGENCPSDVPAPVERHTASSQEARAPHAPGLLCNHGEKYTQNPPASNMRLCQGQLLDPACARADHLDLYDMEKEGLDLLQFKNGVQENIPQELQISDIRNRLSSPAGHSCLGHQQKFKF
ncbi:uncharacterized protein LOC127470787 isoform X1 [Manacus candei]|uniref:uncharacterized protein LOC127470787 isoform X1 n=1 Tax=Manacus candei TaxID=415023 RepID=UPI002226E8D5|nr:uncharacterized protein LOC127470787 isoform X1 [Manacus candei]